MEIITNYWAQITVVLGMLGYILKSTFDYRIKNMELKFKHFYEIKSNKILDLYSKIVEIQMIIDRKKIGESSSFEGNMRKHRLSLDRYYWESEFYFSEITKKAFRAYLDLLKFYETKEIMEEYPNIEPDFERITQILIKEFKNELI
jgi:hypothetical protein